TQDEVGRIVVIKRTHPQYQSNPEFVNMFRDEIKITAQLNHPNIIHVNSYSPVGEYIEMEYVRGKTLRQVFQKVRDLGIFIPQDIVVYVVKEAARGLNY